MPATDVDRDISPFTTEEIFGPPDEGLFKDIHKFLDTNEQETRQLTLREFLTEAWDILEPDTDFEGGWHIDAICEHLEAVYRGDIRRLCILVPPRTTKSIIASICFPAWVWTLQPGKRFFFASHSADLSTKHTVDWRTLLKSGWYQEHWGHLFQLAEDQNEKDHVKNSRNGFRIATSIGGSVTGFGADCLVLDDPHSLNNLGEPALDQVRNFYRKAWKTRLNDRRRGAQICIMQRAHEKDLVDHLIDVEGFEQLMLPNEYDPKRTTLTSIGFTDPRTEPGELLCPTRIDAEETEKLRRDTLDYQTQYNQDPQPEDGQIFKRAWLKVVDHLPQGMPVACVRFWDCAGTDPLREANTGKDPDFTAGAKLSWWPDGQVVVEDMARDRLTPAGVDTLIRNTASVDGRRVKIREEQEPGSAGKAVIHQRLRTLAGYDYKGCPASGPKHVRWQPLARLAEHGLVSLLRGEWNAKFIDELAALPFGKHDDQADAAAGALDEATRARRRMSTVKSSGTA